MPLRIQYYNMIKNDLVLKALRGEQTERTPVWMMRQAGRYLPDYRVLRDKYDFFTRVQTPALAAEITLQPVDQIGVDAAILFSDILVVLQAMGLEVQLIENKGPVLPDPVRTSDDLKRIYVPDAEEKLGYVFDAIRLTKKELNNRVPLIGFAGAPWTLLCYMVEGKGSKTFDLVKSFCFSQPELAHRLLQMLTDTTIAYLKNQVRAGADVIQLFDSWGGLLSPDDFEIFSLKYMRQIIHALRHEVPVILFAKGAWGSIPEMVDTGTTGLGLDWCIRPEAARKLAGPHITLQGNFDPARLLSPIPELKKEVSRMLNGFGPARYIANLGHGILPHVPVDHAKAFVDTVRNHKYQNREKQVSPSLQP
jgi:uroporphyrinogen decarboxylase